MAEIPCCCSPVCHGFTTSSIMGVTEVMWCVARPVVSLAGVLRTYVEGVGRWVIEPILLFFLPSPVSTRLFWLSRWAVRLLRSRRGSDLTLTWVWLSRISWWLWLSCRPSRLQLIDWWFAVWSIFAVDPTSWCFDRPSKRIDMDEIRWPNGTRWLRVDEAMRTRFLQGGVKELWGHPNQYMRSGLGYWILLLQGGVKEK